jgi:hypothetical protein
VRYGRTAWDAWIAQVRDASSQPESVQHQIHRAAGWNYMVFSDARHNAVIYLRRHAHLFPDEARSALLAAADQYARLEAERLVDPAYRGADGPSQPRSIEFWNGLSKGQQLQMLSRARDIDCAAMGQIEIAMRKCGVIE